MVASKFKFNPPQIIVIISLFAVITGSLLLVPSVSRISALTAVEIKRL